MPKIAYLAGYSGGKPARKPADLLRILRLLDAELIDIRKMPYSRHVPDWNRANLQRVFGPRYHHVEAWGNRNYANGGPIEIVNFMAGWRQVHTIERPIILLCTCAQIEWTDGNQAKNCHRLNVGAALKAQGLVTDIRELDWSAGMGAPTLFEEVV
jgi:hypothetical protein